MAPREVIPNTPIYGALDSHQGLRNRVFILRSHWPDEHWRFFYHWGKGEQKREKSHLSLLKIRRWVFKLCLQNPMIGYVAERLLWAWVGGCMGKFAEDQKKTSQNQRLWVPALKCNCIRTFLIGGSGLDGEPLTVSWLVRILGLLERVLPMVPWVGRGEIWFWSRMPILDKDTLSWCETSFQHQWYLKH